MLLVRHLLDPLHHIAVPLHLSRAHEEMLVHFAWVLESDFALLNVLVVACFVFLALRVVFFTREVLQEWCHPQVGQGLVFKPEDQVPEVIFIVLVLREG